MRSGSANVHEALIECLESGCPPTVQQLMAVAERIWTESAVSRSAFSWSCLEPTCPERVSAVRSAMAALNGSDAS